MFLIESGRKIIRLKSVHDSGGKLNSSHQCTFVLEIRKIEREMRRMISLTRDLRQIAYEKMDDDFEQIDWFVSRRIGRFVSLASPFSLPVEQNVCRRSGQREEHQFLLSGL